MPLTVPPLLRQMYERANPAWCDFAEVSQADVAQVLRRWVDQFSVNPPRLSETPSNTTQGSPSGGMQLKASMGPLVTIYTDSVLNKIPLSVPDPSSLLRGVGFTLDAGLKPFRLHQVKVKLSTDNYPPNTNVELQIYRMRGVPGRVIRNATGQIVEQMIQWTPTPLLDPPARVAASQYSGGANATSDFLFDLSAYMLDIEHRNIPAPSATNVGEQPELLFEVYVTDASANGHLRWQVDLADGAPTVAGVGTFADVTWDKRLPNGTIPHDPNDVRAQWTRHVQTQCPCIELDVDTYPATSQEVYALTLPRVPNVAAGSLGRIVFLREESIGTSDLTGSHIVLEVATAGSGGPWTAVHHGDVVAVAQTNYWLRATLNASADLHRSPVLDAAGIEFRIPVDLSVESSLTPLNQDINTPFLDAAIGEGNATVVRTGRRDYHDPASDLLAASAATQLELDHYIGSRHPKVTRDSWLLRSRALVTSAQPALTAETLSLISYLQATKKKIPRQQETVNQVFVVASCPNASTVTVPSGTPLPGTSVGGAEYTGLHYYIRITSTAVSGLAPGMLFAVASNTGTLQLNLLAPGMPAQLAVNDTFELHSAQYTQPPLQWVNADPSDVWWNILTVQLGVPSERIGLASLGRASRAGVPPKVADRAADSTTQGKLLVSNKFTNQFEAKQAIDALSFLMQGATIEVDGQIVFVNIYDLLDANGNPVLPPPEVAATFDVRDYYNLQTPRGLENRATTCSCTYGVDVSLGSDAPSPSTVVFADGDAIAWYTESDLEDLGNTQIPDAVAAWCFNTNDGGLYLATQACRQVVRACSTGMRVWPWRVVDIHPELCVGDRVVVITDQYTDFDPSSKVSIRGLWSFPLVLTHVADRGRDLRGFMLGLSSAIPVRGGPGLSQIGDVAQPSVGMLSFSDAGELLVSVNQGNPPGTGFRMAASTTGAPSQATVDAAPWRAGMAIIANLGTGWTPDTTVYLSVCAYASSDPGSPKSVLSLGHLSVPHSFTGGATVDTLTQTPDYSGNTVSLGWTGHGTGIASYDVFALDSAADGSTAMPHLVGNVAAPPYVFHVSVDIQTGTQPNADTVAFYVVAKDASGNALATSPTMSANYGYPNAPPPGPSVDAPVITPVVGTQEFDISWTGHGLTLGSLSWSLFWRAHPADAWSAGESAGGGNPGNATVAQHDAFYPGHHRIIMSGPPGAPATFQAYVQAYDPGLVATSPVGNGPYYDGGVAP